MHLRLQKRSRMKNNPSTSSGQERRDFLTESKRGLTLIEVVLASAILSICLSGMLVCLTRCMRIMRASKKYHEAVKVLGMGDVKYPLRLDKDLEEMEVFEDSAILDGYTYSRVLEPPPFGDEEEDIHLIRTRVSWMSRERESFHEVVQYIYLEDSGEK
jgi:prepilin-type N-terminal cleavage/methylation domain-containing protein